jgi:hypothetical protein
MGRSMNNAPSGPGPATSSGRPRGPASNLERFLRILTWVFYACFVVLWFKDNIDALKKYRLSYLVALAPLVIVIGARLILAMRRKSIVVRFKLDKTIAAIVLLLIAATVVRWPYLVSGERMIDSDSGICVLMGKHIAEGKIPPICLYGQNYVGSFPSHVYGAFFLVFGYSISVLKIATLLFYLGFIVIQFLLLKNVLSFPFAGVTSLFYVLPFGQLLLVSLDNSLAWGLVLALGTTILWMATKIAFDNKSSWLPALGFVMGFSFWTHQITAPLILAAVLLLMFKARLGLRPLATLTVYGGLGALPLLLQEVFDRFRLVPFLVGGEKGSFAAAKVKATVQILKALLAPLNEDRLGTILLVVLLAGVASLVVLTVRSKGRSRAWVFLLVLAVFGGTHWLSRFSDKGVVRYLFPSYIFLPVFLISPFYLLKSRFKTVFAAVFVAAVVIMNGWPVHVSYAADVRRESVVLKRVVEAMRATGVRYWLAEYWEAYALTAVSGEHPVVETAYYSRYYPYRLAMYDQNDNNGVIFLRTHGPAEDFDKLLTTLGVPFQRQNVGEASLFYDIGSPVYPEVFYERAPASIPGLQFGGIRERAGFLDISFRMEAAGEHTNFGLTVEIPGYSRVTTNIPDEAREFVVEIPAPTQKRISVRYGLDFRALKIPSTEREVTFSCAGEKPGERTDAIVFLRGINQPFKRFGRTARDCEREAVLELRPPKSRGTRLRLELGNPFDFGNRNWYGRYVQAVRISVDGRPAEEFSLPKDRNVLDVALGGALSDRRPVLVTLEFRYRGVFDYAPTQTLAAYLGKAEIVD